MKELDPNGLEAELVDALRAALAFLPKAAEERLPPSARNIFEFNTNKYTLTLASDFNCGVTVAADNSSFAMVINYGLLYFYSRMTRVLFSRIQVRPVAPGEQPVFAHELELSLEATLDVMKRLLSSFWSEDLTSVPELPLEEDTEVLYRRFLLCGFRFAVAHEFAHVLMAVTPAVASYRDAGSAIVDDFLKQVPSSAMSDDTRRQIIAEWGEEFAADILGVELAAKAVSGPDDPPGMKWLEFHAAEWFFVMCDILWRYHMLKIGPLHLSSHPAPFMRLDIIRIHLNAKARDFDLTLKLQELARHMLDQACGTI